MQDNRRTRVVLGVLLALALALITLNAREGTAAPVRGMRSFGGAVFGTAEDVASTVTRPVSGFLSSFTNAAASQSKITSLQREVAGLRAQLSLARLSKADEAQVQSLLALAGRGGYRVVAASVAAFGPPYEDSVTLDAGSADGIKPNETVLSGSGLVGRVTSVSGHSCTVLLDTDASSTVGVEIAGTGQIGWVTGTGKTQSGPAALTLQILDENAVLHVGEQLVTYGSVDGSPYVPGVPVGVISRVVASPNSLTKLATVRPYADDGALGVVGVVVVVPAHNPHDSVLPPPPAVAPAPSATPSPGG